MLRHRLMWWWVQQPPARAAWRAWWWLTNTSIAFLIAADACARGHVRQAELLRIDARRLRIAEEIGIAAEYRWLLDHWRDRA